MGIDEGRLTGEVGGAGDFCLAGEAAVFCESDPAGDVGEPAREEPPAGGESRSWLCCDPEREVDGAGGAREPLRRFGVDPLELEARGALPPALADLLCPAGGAKRSFAVPAELLRRSRPTARDEFRGGCAEAGRGGGGGAGDAERAALADGGRITSSTNAGVNAFGSSPEDVVSEKSGICCKFSTSSNAYFSLVATQAMVPRRIVVNAPGTGISCRCVKIALVQPPPPGACRNLQKPRIFADFNIPYLVFRRPVYYLSTRCQSSRRLLRGQSLRMLHTLADWIWTRRRMLSLGAPRRIPGSRLWS